MRAWSLRDLRYKQYFSPIRLQPKRLESRIWVAVTGLQFNNSLCGVCCLPLCENPGFSFGPGTKRQHTRKAQSSINWAELIRWSLWGLRISNLQIFLPSLICFPETTHCFSQPLFSYRKSGLAGCTCSEMKKAAMETMEKSLRNRRRLWSRPVQTTQGDMLMQTAWACRHLLLAAASISVIHFPSGLNACLCLKSL